MSTSSGETFEALLWVYSTPYIFVHLPVRQAETSCRLPVVNRNSNSLRTASAMLNHQCIGDTCTVPGTSTTLRIGITLKSHRFCTRTIQLR